MWSYLMVRHNLSTKMLSMALLRPSMEMATSWQSSIDVNCELVNRLGSTGHYNSLSVDHRWSLPSKNFSGSSVHPLSDELQMVLHDQVKVGAFRKVLSK